MVIIVQPEVFDESEGNEKFSFARITRKFKFTKRTKSSTDKETLPAKNKFNVRNLFRSRKKEKEPEVKFESGYGELC
jgi:hypothetical protein